MTTPHETARPGASRAGTLPRGPREAGDWLEELRGRLPADVLVEDPDVVAAYAVDRAGQEHGTARALARVRTTEQVSTCLEVAERHGTPVVTRGAGSGLCGGANALDGCLLLSTERLDRVVELDRANRVMVVEPGVVTATIRSLAAEAGLHYPPDPGSVGFSTIGGNVATNAGGLCCVKYGVTGDFVRALEVVLPAARSSGPGTAPSRGSPVSTSPACWSARRGRSGSSPASRSACARPAAGSDRGRDVRRVHRRGTRHRRGGAQGLAARCSR